MATHDFQIGKISCGQSCQLDIALVMSPSNEISLNIGGVRIVAFLFVLVGRLNNTSLLFSNIVGSLLF